jgi:hypothetical protein
VRKDEASDFFLKGQWLAGVALEGATQEDLLRPIGDGLG